MQMGHHTVDGPCRSGGVGTRLHHAACRRLAGIHVEKEVVLPEFVAETKQGVREDRMDHVVSRPGGVSWYLIDVRTVDARAPRYTDGDAGFVEVA